MSAKRLLTSSTFTIVMLSYTVYNRAGGQGKSVLTRDLAAAHAEIGHKVLIVDLDGQKEAVSDHYDLDYDKNDSDADRLTLHIMGRPGGSFDDLTHTAEPGVDILPRHEEHNDLEDILDDVESIASREIGNKDFDRYAQLLRVLQDNNVSEKYDVVICDPNAKADDAYYSALYATRNVLIPAEANPKGVGSIPDVYDTASNFADAKGINIGNIGVIATRADNRKTTKREMAEELRDEYDGVTYFNELSIFDDAAKNKRSIFAEIKQLDRVRSSQEDILPKYRTLLAHIMEEMGSPLSQSVLESEDFWEGDDFWGESITATTQKEEMEVK